MVFEVIGAEADWITRTKKFDPPLGRERFPNDHLMRCLEGASATIIFDHKTKIMKLQFLEAHPQGHGHASAIINLIKNIALKHDYSLQGNAVPYNQFDKSWEPLGSDVLRLKNWYSKQGIEVTGKYGEFRFPR